MMGYLVVRDDLGALCDITERSSIWTGLGCSKDTTAAFFLSYEDASTVVFLLNDPELEIVGPIYSELNTGERIPVSIVESLGVKCSFYREEPSSKLPWPW